MKHLVRSKHVVIGLVILVGVALLLFNLSGPQESSAPVPLEVEALPPLQLRQIFSNDDEVDLLAEESGYEEGPEAEAEAIRWFYQQRAYPLDTIDPALPMQAQQQVQQARSHQLFAAQANWVSVGPEPIGNTSGSYFRDSGRIIAIAVDPGTASHWLIGTANGGIWETKDSGATWASRTDDQITLATGAIAFAPGNPSIVYAGLGDPISGRFYVGGYGVLKSTNGGTDWQLVSSPPLTGTAFKKLYVHPTEANTVVGAAQRTGQTPPEQGGSTVKAGLYRSTDGGVQWTLTLEGNPTSLVVVNGNFNQQYAAIDVDTSFNYNFGLQRSTDGGQTWSAMPVPWDTSQPRRIELALAPSAAGTLYASVSTGNDLLGLWRTDNAEATTPTWTQVPMGADIPNGFCSLQCWFDHVISVDPTNPNTLYAGGIVLWKCTNCGAAPTWVRPDADNPDFYSSYYHVDQHAMTWSGNQLLLGNDGGLYSSTDGGFTWTSHNKGLATNQMYVGSAHPTDPNQLLAGLQDIGVPWRKNDSNFWLLASVGDGFGTAFAKNNPDTHLAYALTRLSIYRTTDGFQTETKATGNIDTNTAPFGPRMEICPNNDEVFIAGTDKVWRTADFFSSSPADPTWIASSPFPTTTTSTRVSALAFAPSDPTCNTYAVGATNGFGNLVTVYATTDGGTTWIDLSPNLPNRTVTDVEFDPTDPTILYATLSGYYDPDQFFPPGSKPGHVFKTGNATSGPPNWVDLSPPVNLPHNVIVIDPQDTKHLYVGTDLGIWETQDGGTNWVHHGPSEGLPNVGVTDLEINRFTGRLYAFTYGRSAFMLVIGSGQQSVYLPLVIK